MKRPPFHRSIWHAVEGLISLLKSERNFQIEILGLLVNLFLIVWLKLSTLDSVLIFGVCILVLTFEIMNTAIEKICDFVQPEKDEKIKFNKDISAGAVLLSVILALFTGIMVYPKYF